MDGLPMQITQQTGPKRLKVRTCLECGSDITGAHGRSKWCFGCVRQAKATLAHLRWRKVHPAPSVGITEATGAIPKRNSANGRIAPSIPERDCKQCNRTYRPKKSLFTGGFCSRECAFLSRKRTPAPRLCECGVPLLPRTRACAKCVEQRKKRSAAQCYVRRPRITKQCQGCGAPITGTASKVRCTACTTRKAKATHRAKHGRVNKHRLRAKKFGVAYEPINPIMLFDRDRWRCQVCGIKTPKKLRGSFKPNAPELDHRIPMAMGGPHTWANVQCACRSCNTKKGSTRIVGQLPLFVCIPA